MYRWLHTSFPGQDSWGKLMAQKRSNDIWTHTLRLLRLCSTRVLMGSRSTKVWKVHIPAEFGWVSGQPDFLWLPDQPEVGRVYILIAKHLSKPVNVTSQVISTSTGNTYLIFINVYVPRQVQT